jgi:PAS domain S-box-containing protein
METKNQSSLRLKVTDNITTMLSYWDKDLVCRFANAAFEDWSGKSKKEMIDKITLKELLKPESYERNLPHINGALGGATQSFQRELLMQDGSIRHTLTNYYPDIINGEVVGFFVNVADVTGLKLYEKELITKNERINEQNTRLLNFSNIVSHNLKSYSNNLASILDLFSVTDSEEEKNKLFDFLHKISEGFTSTVNHLNEIAKTQNLSKTIPVRINLNEFIEKSKTTLLVQIETTNTKIKNNVNKEMELLVNPAYMDSILLNLLTNAIKYRQENIAPIIELNCYNKADKTIFEIKDNGMGINLEKHGAKLFGMYKTFHGNADATGVGLYITKYQVETMGGIIEVESEVNVGTTFTLTFNAIQNL